MSNKLNAATDSQNQRKAHNKFISAALAAAIVVSTLLPMQLSAQSDRHTVSLENESSFSIYQVFVSPVYLNTWGYDRLGNHVLQPGYQLNLSGLRNGAHYDLKFVDEDGDTCIVSNVPVNYDTQWSITDSWLLNCEFHR